MSEKPKKVAPKRKAENQNDQEAPPAKKQDDGESKLMVMFVKDIPSSVPEFCINQNISSGLVVGFSIQEIANVLFNEFFGNTIHSDTQQQQIEAQIGQWMADGYSPEGEGLVFIGTAHFLLHPGTVSGSSQGTDTCKS